MKFTEIIGFIFIWLMIFIVGSLIVTFLVVPGSFQSFKYQMKSSMNDFVGALKDKTSSNPLEYSEEINTKISCFEIEIGADYYSWVNDKDLKEQECKVSCAQRIMKYQDFKCKEDKLYCYCLTK